MAGMGISKREWVAPYKRRKRERIKEGEEEVINSGLCLIEKGEFLFQYNEIGSKGLIPPYV